MHRRRNKVHIQSKPPQHPQHPLPLHNHPLCLEQHSDPLRKTSPHLRAGNGVAAQRRVDVDFNTSLSLRVQFLALPAVGATGARVLGAGSGDLEVEAVGVVLRAVYALGGVQGDDLVAEDEVSGCDVGGESDGAGEVVGLTVMLAMRTELGKKVKMGSYRSVCQWPKCRGRWRRCQDPRRRS